MTLHLLAHTKLFRAGIARSGAYNRTLTPFGFQAEERTFWDSPETYLNLSPFSHCPKIAENKAPVLLIHGAEDENAGTYPLQSERMFDALKGFGAVVRLCVLPHESHGYRARESILHCLFEQERWLELHVENAGPRAQVEEAEFHASVRARKLVLASAIVFVLASKLRSLL